MPRGFDTDRFLAAVDEQEITARAASVLARVAQASSIEKVFAYLDQVLYHSPKSLHAEALRVALNAARKTLPAGKPRTIREIDLDDFSGYRGKPSLLFHHGNLTIAATEVLPTTVVTGDLVVKGVLVDSCSPGPAIAVGGNLKARAIAVAGTLVVGGDVTVDQAIVGLGVRSSYPDVKARPLRVGGTLRAKLLVLDDHKLEVTGEEAVARTLKLPRDIALFTDDVRAFDDKKQLNASMLRAKVLDGESFLVR